MRSAFVALALIAPAEAQAATLYVSPHTVAIEGPIVSGDAGRLASFLALADAAGWQIQTIRLRSPGGVVEEALSMARDVRAHGLNTSVEAYGQCVSACFLPFVAGRIKTVEEGSRIGVHSATRTHGVGPDDTDTTALMVLFARQMGAPGMVTDRMTVVSSTAMAWLSNTELRAMGAVVVTSLKSDDWTTSEN